MTFSICVHERDVTDGQENDDRHRFGVAVTTRLPGVGTLCPFVSESGAVATQSLVNVDLGRRGLQYIDDGLAVDDALESLLNADCGAPHRQLHGVDTEGTFAFTGEECRGWSGHREGDGATAGTSNDHYTIAGNLLTGEDVLEATADAYESGDRNEPLAARLIDALAAGHEAGGDKREELPIQSAAVLVRTTEDHAVAPYYNDLRVDATETPIADLCETYALAVRGYEDVMERYSDAYDDDSMAAVETRESERKR